jgi:ribosomal-protein-alanine N-acetyltransferase
LPTITTERLILRPWTLADVDTLHTLWTNPEARRYLWDDEIISREQATEIVDACLGESGFWNIENKGQPGIVGFCGFRRMKQSHEIEVLYGLHPDAWGLGLATEASSAALAHLWSATDVPRVFGETEAANAKSIAVLRGLGMRIHSTSADRVLFVLDRPAPTARRIGI